MDDFIGLFVVLGFAALSVISNLAKNKQAPTEPVGKSLKDILTTLQGELQGKNEPISQPKVGKKKKKVKPTIVDSEFVEVASGARIAEVSVVSEVKNSTVALNREQLRQAMIWKEILDPPVSMR